MMKFKRHINVAVVMFWVMFAWYQQTGEVLYSYGVYKTRASCNKMAKSLDKALRDNLGNEVSLFCAPTNVPIHLPREENR